jgi:hypothetical protein
MNDSPCRPIRVSAVVDRAKLDGVSILLAIPRNNLQVHGDYQIDMLTPLAALDLIEQLRSAINDLHSLRADGVASCGGAVAPAAVAPTTLSAASTR